MPSNKRPFRESKAERIEEELPKPKQRKSSRLAKRTGKIKISEATLAAHKSVAIINGLKKDISQKCEDFEEIADTNIFELDDVGVAEEGLDIVIHIEIERVDFDELQTLNSQIEALSPPLSVETLSLLATPSYECSTASNSLTFSPCYSPFVITKQPEVHTHSLGLFRELELRNRAKPNYLQHQPQIDRAARAFLINWLVTITEAYGVDTEILFLAVSYIDRYLSKVMLARGHLRILGMACLYIALKFESTRWPRLAHLIAGNLGGGGAAAQIDVKQIVQMELNILKTLAYDLRQPSVYTFICGFALATAHDTSDTLQFLAVYIAELALLETELYLQFLPSQLAAGAYALARYILGFEIWSEALTAVANWRLEQLKATFVGLSKTHYSARKILTQAIQTKYADAEYNEVATIPGICVDEELFDYLVESYYEV